MEMSEQLHAPATLPPGKSPLHPLDGRHDGPQNQSRYSGEKKKIFHCLCWEPNPRRPGHNLVIMTEVQILHMTNQKGQIF